MTDYIHWAPKIENVVSIIAFTSRRNFTFSHHQVCRCPQQFDGPLVRSFYDTDNWNKWGQSRICRLVLLYITKISLQLFVQLSRRFLSCSVASIMMNNYHFCFLPKKYFSMADMVGMPLNMTSPIHLLISTQQHLTEFHYHLSLCNWSATVLTSLGYTIFF